jgi:hypothetical protein
MATGDVTVFEEFVDQIGEEQHNFDSDTLKLGIIDDTTPPTAADASPTWSDYSGNEVGTGGGYTANGETLANVSWTEADGTATLDADDVSLSQDGSGFTDGAYGILYNDTNGTDMAIAFVELDAGGGLDETAGDITISWNASGILTIAVS